MKLRILGSSAPYAPAGGACNGYLLEDKGLRIMLDCGNGSFANLQKYCDFRLLDALIITHYHPDHFHDYHCIRHAIAGSLREKTRQKPLLVVASQEGGPWLEMQEWPEAFQLVPLEGYTGRKLQLGSLNFQFLETRHTVKSFALSVTDQNKKMVYTSDTSWYETLIDFASGADLLICESSTANAAAAVAKEKGHLTAGQAGYLAAQAAAKHLVLTHLWPDMDHTILVNEAQEVFDKDITLAKDGLSFLL